MIRILDLYNFGDESIIANPIYKAIFSSIPVRARRSSVIRRE